MCILLGSNRLKEVKKDGSIFWSVTGILYDPVHPVHPRPFCDDGRMQHVGASSLKEV
jgi:hypothetical protein